MGIRPSSDRANVTFGGSGGMKTIPGLELPYPQVISQARIRDNSSRRRNKCNSIYKRFKVSRCRASLSSDGVYRLGKFVKVKLRSARLMA